MKAAILGIGALGGFGCGITALEHALAQTPPIGQWVDFDTTQGPIRVPGLLADPSALVDYMPKRTLRRMDHNNRVALTAAFLALSDAGILEKKDRGRLGIIVATGYGATCNNFDFQHLSSDGADFCGSPTKFSNSVHNAAAAYISISLAENGPNHSISHLDMSFPAAIMTALQWLREDRVDKVLVGGTDEFCKAIAYKWHCDHMASEPHDPIWPLEAAPPMVGEGACFFVLSPANDIAPAYGVIQRIAMERNTRHPDNLPPAGAYIVSADASPHQIQVLCNALPDHATVAAYPYIYGVMPVGAAFDLAIATLCLKHGKIFASKSQEHIPLPNGPICCFQFGIGGTSSWFIVDQGTHPA